MVRSRSGPSRTASTAREAPITFEARSVMVSVSSSSVVAAATWAAMRRQRREPGATAARLAPGLCHGAFMGSS